MYIEFLTICITSSFAVILVACHTEGRKSKVLGTPKFCEVNRWSFVKVAAKGKCAVNICSISF